LLFLVHFLIGEGPRIKEGIFQTKFRSFLEREKRRFLKEEREEE
jgi:hypothetical protein